MILTQLHTSTVKSIALQNSKALTYMHGRDPRVIHHDIKPSDIMVSGYVKPKSYMHSQYIIYRLLEVIMSMYVTYNWQSCKMY